MFNNDYATCWGLDLEATSEIDWLEDESLALRVGNLVQEYISWCLTLFDINWKPATPWGMPAHGSAFASNVKVPDFFRLVYGVKRRREPFPRPPGSFYEKAAETAFHMSGIWSPEWAEESEPAEPGSKLALAQSTATLSNPPISELVRGSTLGWRWRCLGLMRSPLCEPLGI